MVFSPVCFSLHRFFQVSVQGEWYEQKDVNVKPMGSCDLHKIVRFSSFTVSEIVFFGRLHFLRCFKRHYFCVYADSGCAPRFSVFFRYFVFLFRLIGVGFFWLDIVVVVCIFTFDFSRRSA